MSNESKVPLFEHYTYINNKRIVQISCTAHIVYTFHLSLRHANFDQFKAKQVLLLKKGNFSPYRGGGGAPPSELSGHVP